MQSLGVMEAGLSKTDKLSQTLYTGTARRMASRKQRHALNRGHLGLGPGWVGGTSDGDLQSRLGRSFPSR